MGTVWGLAVFSDLGVQGNVERGTRFASMRVWHPPSRSSHVHWAHVVGNCVSNIVKDINEFTLVQDIDASTLWGMAETKKGRQRRSIDMKTKRLRQMGTRL